MICGIPPGARATDNNPRGGSEEGMMILAAASGSSHLYEIWTLIWIDDATGTKRCQRCRRNSGGIPSVIFERGRK